MSDIQPGSPSLIVSIHSVGGGIVGGGIVGGGKVGGGKVGGG